MSTAGAVARGLIPPTRPEGFGPPDMLRTIFTHPRATMRWVLDHGDGGLWVLLLVPGLVAQVLAIGSAAVRFFASPVPESSGGAIVFAVGLCVAGAVGYIGSLVIAARLVGGVARPGETLRALAWGGVPVVAALPYLLASRWLDPTLLPFAVAVLRGFVFVTGLLSTFLTIETLAEANRLPWERSAAAFVLAVVLGITSAVVLSPVLSQVATILQGVVARSTT